MTERKRNVIRFLRHEEDRNLLLSNGSTELTVTGSEDDLGFYSLARSPAVRVSTVHVFFTLSFYSIVGYAAGCHGR
ncbi:hypothetical protein [Marinoscillum luteum]|uniref:Uncharacterized protein n=1 Tax=Marinoscillum luteum TaxID=861051 RepID=A0ABW7N7L2_9BACT